MSLYHKIVPPSNIIPGVSRPGLHRDTDTFRHRPSVTIMDTAESGSRSAPQGACARQLGRGAVLGLIYGSGQLLQTWGLAMISPSVSGFVTGMYVVFTPILAAVLLRQRTPPVVWLAVGLATLGLALLSLNGFSVDEGVWLTLLSALLYGLHIVALGHWSRADEALDRKSVV